MSLGILKSSFERFNNTKFATTLTKWIYHQTCVNFVTTLP